MTPLDDAISRALHFLHKRQLASGEFPVYRSRLNESVLDSTPFASAIIAYSLGFALQAPIDEASKRVAREMLDGATRFFVDERETASVWRYWTKSHPFHGAIPPDLDDTVYVSDVLKQHNVAFEPNRELLLLNRNRDGLFYTWLAPRWEIPPFSRVFWRVVMRQCLRPFHLYAFWKMNESAPADIDGVVNANTLFYLGDGPQTRNVAPFLADIVRQNREDCCDKWHLNRFTFYYATGRCFGAGLTGLDAIRDTVIERIHGFVDEDESGRIGENALDTALATCALLNWRASSTKDLAALNGAIRFLLNSQNPDGGWPSEVLYYGGPKRFYGWGSEELTTGFCVEALVRCRELMTQP